MSTLFARFFIKNPAVLEFVALIQQMESAKDKERHNAAYFRIAYDTHLSLSKIADHKAHLMLGINTLVLSFVITKKHMGVLAKMPDMLLPDILIVLLSLSCIVLAILATRPSIAPSISKKGSMNWLFFGDFTQVSPQSFDRAIRNFMRDPEARQEAFSRDLYWLGVSLSRKYWYLSQCYTVFYTGLLIIAAVLGLMLLRVQLGL
jgi:hypothetical protein